MIDLTDPGLYPGFVCPAATADMLVFLPASVKASYLKITPAGATFWCYSWFKSCSYYGRKTSRNYGNKARYNLVIQYKILKSYTSLKLFSLCELLIYSIDMQYHSFQ